jgi:hypothetical protein
VWSAANNEEKRLYIIVRCMTLFHASIGVSMLTIQEKINARCIFATISI